MLSPDDHQLSETESQPTPEMLYIWSMSYVMGRTQRSLCKKGHLFDEQLHWPSVR